jgi:hypothetical protein
MGNQHLHPLSRPEFSPPRYSTRPLPPYRHVPGLTPHPVRDPSGHLFGVEESAPSAACRHPLQQWQECTEYLYGADLFNRAFLWEAHEAWEVVWIDAGKSTEPAEFVQGLIQISAALLRSHLGTPRGAENLVTKARTRLQRVEEQLDRVAVRTYMGLAVRSWRRSVEDYLNEGSGPYPFIHLEVGPPS